MPVKGIEIKNIQVMLDDGKWYPLGKIESAELISAKDEIPDNAIGLDMKDCLFADEMEFTAEIKVDNPLRLKLQLLGMPVVSVVMCRNCWKRHAHHCPAYGHDFEDHDSCSKGEYKT